jgi:two-component system response regulator HydG
VNDQTIKFHSILRDARSGRFPLIFAIPGSGQIARYAMEGGAHFLMVLNAGLYRMAGVSSLGSFMPFGNANDQTEHLLRNQIIPRAYKVPIVAGVMANDPVLPLTTRFRRLQELGVAGITNWPAVGLIDGIFREILEREGLTVKAEIEMLMEAKKSGFVTFGFALDAKDAAAMADAGADGLVLAIGWTHETLDIHEKSDRIQHAVVKINKMIEVVLDTGKDPVFIFYGGAITLPEDTAELYKRTRVHGYGVGSALERIPISRLITNIVKQLRSIPRYIETPSDGEGFGELVGSSPIMLKLYHLIKQVAPYDVNVCIEGESGAGKELVALQLHHLSYRNTQPFITLNCGAIPDTLIESELFGHEKGAFTGAMARRLGKFELADRGSLFLDEVAELSPKAQVSLLRAIQQKEISRVGGEKAIPVDVRIIAATHQNLETLVDKERFRADLYFRLNNITIRIPPLRDRLQDIPALVNRFLIELGLQFGRKVLGVTPDFVSRLMKHSWPGNVRELKHVLSRAILLEDGPILEGEDFSPKPVFNLHESSQRFSLTSAPSVSDTKGNLLISALKATGGNKSKAANLLGISRKTLYTKLRKMDHLTMR